MKISQEKIFEEAIKSSFKIINKHRDGSLEPHFIVAGEYYSNLNHGNIDRLKQFIRDQMKLYQIKSVKYKNIFHRLNRINHQNACDILNIKK